MPVQAIAGGEQSHDHRNPPQPADHKNENQAGSSGDGESGRHREPKLLIHGEARLILDADHHVLRVELISQKGGPAIQEIVKADLIDQDYHGILVDIDT